MATQNVIHLGLNVTTNIHKHAITY